LVEKSIKEEKEKKSNSAFRHGVNGRVPELRPSFEIITLGQEELAIVA
jgi:hypothetical protein